MAATRESGRLKDGGQRRMLDDAARMRRARKALESLEHDNFHEDPHADLGMFYLLIYHCHYDLNDFLLSMGFKKSFAQLIEEEKTYIQEHNYISAQAPPSQFPERHFCSVCGFPSNYTCIPCGSRYCSVRCLGTHLDTRCLKWTA
ncbi:hypothetical protein J437_LFUL018185 [Ladona fulva]|uniref:HIT-type domain-containing protein n=1 Tax=Ladona fulva TaxID=123851 RepID=A0A8K0KNT4_LADFU|nr:hypothetical protein J437_LFUL018185 [Ladona fulva]